MNLSQGLELEDPIRLAIVGAGGKTSALFRLGRQLKRPLLLSTTTHLGISQVALADEHLIVSQPGELSGWQASAPQLVRLVSGPETEDGRASGLSGETLEALRLLAEEQQLPLLIEADGSRGLPLKAPAAHEPAIPAWVSSVLVVAGLAGLGKPLSPEWVHRPEQFAALSGLQMGNLIRSQDVTRVLDSPLGGLKNIPQAARRMLLLNQADTDDLRSAAGRMAQELLGTYETILVGSLSQEPETAEISAAYRRIAGVVLAAGGSSRLGRPKALLEWRGRPFVRSAAEAALAAGLDPVYVVTGEFDAAIRQALVGLNVKIVPNPDWQAGQAGSIKAALRALPGAIGAAIFMLVDQPQIPAGFLRAEMELHHQTLAPLIIPQVEGRRANPVLFDRRTFGELSRIEGDAGGRQIFAHFPVQWLPWNDARLLLDVDTLEDYQRLLELE